MALKRLGSLGLVLLLISSFIAGCGGNGNATEKPVENSTSTAEKKEPVKLKLFGAIPAESGPQQVLDTWNAEHPDIQVEYVMYVNDDEGNLKLDTALLAGQDADIVLNYNVPRLAKRAKAGIALDLSRFTDYNIDEKLGAMAKDWQVDGKYYAVPTTRRVYHFWLNKDALDQAGLQVPTDWTWEDLKEYAKTLKQEERWGLLSSVVCMAIGIDGEMASAGYVKSDGTSNFDNEYVRKYLETLNAMMKTDKTTPPLGQQITSKMPVETMFLKGEGVILNSGEWIFRYANDLKSNPRDFKIAFAPIPRLSDDFKFQGGLGEGLSINPKSEHIDEAWEFIKWYTDGGMLPMVKLGRVPASNAVQKEEILKLLTTGAEDTYDMKSLENVYFGNYPSYTLTLEQQVIDLRREEYEKFFVGKNDLEQTVSAIVKRHNEFLKQNKK